ncbi:MAG: 16S rRNA (uracil(1498)-N(3))-methyltransferase [Thermosynechococcaceae cyanobacterium MS004]|nr:16S rRNA (uracil(1498)-N(3))-methyltransferase [Thermosynechococcaceae cyanobacterium MS004]
MGQLQRLAIAVHQCRHPTILLTAAQQHYLSRVLRLKEGDRFIALCSSDWWLAELCPDQTAQMIEQIAAQTELMQPITLCAALMKGQGFEDVVRAATELGVSHIVPLLSDRTLVNPSEQKLERWRRIAVEAAEQSCRQQVPEILFPIRFEQALSLCVNQDRRSGKDGLQAVQTTDGHDGQNHLICVTREETPNLLSTLGKLPKLGMLIMVGPEGGWTAAEEDLAIAQGFTPVSLGRRVLRAVTASIAAVSILSTHLESTHLKNVQE